MASSPETALAIVAPKKMDSNATGSPPNSSSDSGPLPESPPPTPSDPPPSPLPEDTPNASSPEKSPPSPSSSSSSSSSSPSSSRGSSSSSPSHHSSDYSFSPPTPPSSGGSKSHSERSHSKSLPSPPLPPSPTTPSSENSRASPSGEQSDTNLSLVLGITFSVGVFLFLMIVGMAIYCTRKKKPTNGRHYYDNPVFKGGLYNGGSLPRWQNGGDYNGGGVPPPPGAAHSPGGGWHQSPPGMMMSGEMSEPYTSYHGGLPQPPPTPPMALGFNQSTFTYDELAAATNGFSRENLLGQGGFGYVYKGVLPNRKEIAVKQLKAGSGQGDREFRAEVEIISRVHHRHLVSLVGFCIAGTNRMLVYEFAPNNTLEHHLHVQGHPTMDWPTRLKIAIGSAKGLAYLHEDCHPRIIHRDIKTANILLDNKFEAMVADFGLAKLSLDTNTHVSTRVMGTFGYLAPEYASSGKLTEKSDVFSFGIMLLELITGRRPVDNRFSDMDDSLVDWARPIVARALADRNFDELVDRRLENNYEPNEMARMAACAAASVRHSARRRPKMSQIVRALEGDVSLEDLNEGVKPGQSSLLSSSSDFDSGSGSYSSNMKRFRQIALESVDFSNDYSGIASEYGHNPSNSSSSDESNYNGGQRKRSPSGL